MTVDEVRAIREKKSLETIGMTTEELNKYFDKGANEIQEMINEIQIPHSESVLTCYSTK